MAVFLLRREKNLLRPEKKKVPVVCLAGVSVFGSGGKLAVFLLRREKNSLRPEKKSSSPSSVWRVCQFLVLAGNWQFFCCGGKKNRYDRKKKFQSSVWRVCQFLVLADNWQIFVAAGKKFVTTENKKVPVICLAGCAVVSVFGSGDYDRKKKVPVVIKFVLIQLELKLIQIR